MIHQIAQAGFATRQMMVPTPSDGIGGGFQLSFQFETYVVILDASSAAVKVPFETGTLFPSSRF